MKHMHVVPHRDTDEIKTSLMQRGYALVRGLFEPALIADAYAKVVAILQDEGWGDGEAKPLQPVRRINSEPFFACIRKMMEQEILHDLAYNGILNQILCSIIGQDVFPHPRKMLRISYPLAMSPKDRIPPHQDVYYVKGELDTFTVWTPLSELPTEKGGLIVLEGSHNQGIFPTEANDEGRFGCTICEADLDAEEWRSAHYLPGDALIMHSMLVHSAGANQSDSFRLSLDCRFSAKEGVINRDQLLPPYYPNLPDWETLLPKWAGLGRFQAPKTLELQSPDADLSACMDRPSILKGASV